MTSIQANTNKVWLEISRSAANHNFQELKKHLKRGTELWAVVKSNAYGHGIFAFSKVANEIGVHPVRSRARPAAAGRVPEDRGAATSNGVDGFCVDSVIEGLKLRGEGIKKSILVLGPTLSSRLKDAVSHKITISVSNLEALKIVARLPRKSQPEIFLKVDTGMHRQGVFISEISKVARFIKQHRLKLVGLLSHFASAKDLNYPTFSEQQFKSFQEAAALLQRAGFPDLKKSIAATGGMMINKKYHLDLARCGIGLYGIYPSSELEAQLSKIIRLRPVLSWHALVSEVKKIKPDEYVGYDLTERVTRPTTLAIVPIGYWHGLPWALSGVGLVLIRGRRAKILGRVSMDLIAVDATGIPVKAGDRVTIIGRQGKEEITAREIARLAHTTPYEIITRINPLIERRIV